MLHAGVAYPPGSSGKISAMLRSLRVLALLAAALHSIPAMAIEEPAYTVVETATPFEIRDYGSYVVAETLLDGPFEGVGNEAFQRLFGYISGNNRGAEKIPMTAPVEQQRAGNRWRVAFVLPASFTLATAPLPTDNRVTLAEVPPRRVALVRYRGVWSEARYDEELALLRRFIAERALRETGEPVFARYDPPFMPWFLRRNEIHIPVGSPTAR